MTDQVPSPTDFSRWTRLPRRSGNQPPLPPAPGVRFDETAGVEPELAKAAKKSYDGSFIGQFAKKLDNLSRLTVVFSCNGQGEAN